MHNQKHEAEKVGDKVKVTGKCSLTGVEHSVTVPANGYDLWKSGELIQIALPTVSRDDREFLVSGIAPGGWDTFRDM